MLKCKYSVITLLLFFLACLPLCSHQTSSEEEEKVATIRLLLEKSSEGFLLEARGPYAVYNPENGKKVSSGLWGKRFYLHPHSEGIKWGENFLGIFQLQIVPTSPTTSFLINGVQHQGSLEIYHVEGKLHLINELSIESYIKATLSDQLDDSLPQTTLDALAICARTNAYYRALSQAGAFYHLSAEEVGYAGSGLMFQKAEVDRAVDNTRYLIMLFEGKPFPCTWSENSLGKTASYSAIFRKGVSTPKGVITPEVGKEQGTYNWSLTVDTQELAKIVKSNRITAIDLFVDPPSGRVYATRFYDGSHVENIDFFTLQKALGKERLKSNDFTLTIKGNTAHFQGRGAGAGVGLCLYTARKLGERGEDAPDILTSFFPNTTLEKARSLPAIPLYAAKGAAPVQEKKKPRKLLR